MSDMDLGTLRGHIELDVAEFDKKYGKVDTLLTQLEHRTIKDVQVGADVTEAEARLNQVEQAVRTVDGATAEATVSADVRQAEARLGEVDAAVKAVDGATAEATVDADTADADRKLGAVEQFLTGVLDGMYAEAAVAVDDSRARAGIAAVEGLLSGISGETVSARVDADVSPAVDAIDGLGAEGEDAGDDAGDGLFLGILASLAAIPVAGALVGIGKAIGGALLGGIQDGLNQEVTADLFSARTGLDADTARKFGLAAGEAYANNFGESVATNMDTARYALGEGLINEHATAAEIQTVVEQLTGITDIFEYDMPALTRAVGQMLKTGLVEDAQEAFDLITVGSQGMIADDLMDTLIEYSNQFEILGLDGQTAMGLIRQAMAEGARDTDVVADALKEMGIRIREGTDPAVEALENLGLNAGNIIKAFQEGGPDAAAAMDEVFDALRDMDEQGGNTQEVIAGLFGGPGEDLGASLFHLNLDTAVAKLGAVEGAAGTALAALTDNAANDVEEARRNIETAADGIKGALASAFSDPLSNLADWVSGNRVGVLEFFGGVGNAAFTMAESTVEAAATMIEAIGSIPAAFDPVFENLAGIIGTYQGLAALIPGMPSIPQSILDDLGGFREGLDGIEDDAQTAADALRNTLIDQGLTPAQEKFNEFLADELVSARVADATSSMAEDIGKVGERIEDVNGIEWKLNGQLLTTSEAGAALDEQLRNAVGALGDVQGAAAEAGESQATLKDLWKSGRDALVDQIEAMGFTREEAVKLAEAYGAIPEQVETSATLEDARAVNALNDLLVLVDESTGTITVDGDKTRADVTLGELIGEVNASDGSVTINGDRYPADATLEEYLGVLNTSGGMVEIDGFDLPARSTLGSLVGDINEEDGTVTINGNDYPADETLGSFLSKVGISSATAKILANSWAADREVENWRDRNNGKTITQYIRVRRINEATPVATGGDVDALIGLAGGGAVFGPGTGTSDDIPATHPSGAAFALSNGEHVWTDAEVQALGGHAEVYELRAMALSGELARLLDMGTPVIRRAEGGPAGAPGPGAATSGGGGGGDTFHIVNYYPQAEPASTTVQRARTLYSGRSRW